MECKHLSGKIYTIKKKKKNTRKFSEKILISSEIPRDNRIFQVEAWVSEC